MVIVSCFEIPSLFHHYLFFFFTFHAHQIEQIGRHVIRSVFKQSHWMNTQKRIQIDVAIRNAPYIYFLLKKKQSVDKNSTDMLFRSTYQHDSIQVWLEEDRKYIPVSLCIHMIWLSLWRQKKALTRLTLIRRKFGKTHFYSPKI